MSRFEAWRISGYRPSVDSSPFFSKRTLQPLAFLAVWVSQLTPSLFSQDIQRARDLVGQWVEVEKTISEERTDWSLEKDVIGDMISLLKTEEESLGGKIETAEEGISEAEKKRSGLVEEREEYIAASEYLESQIEVVEKRILELYKKFPAPLQQEVSKVYTRVPQEGETSRLSVSQRMQSVIAILSQADKFNGGVQLVTEIQQIGSSQAEVDILYFGLAGAFFKDKEGTYAGVGYPTENGWSWDEAPDAADKISDLFAVYQGEAQAEFVLLPVTIR